MLLFVYEFFSKLLNEFLQPEIIQKLSSVQKISGIVAVADTKIKCCLYILRVGFYLWLLFKLISCWNPRDKEEKKGTIESKCKSENRHNKRN